jgi:hypothetical protein
MGNQNLPWIQPLSLNRPAQPQLARAVVMVRPVDFAFNEQTGADNVFQHRLNLPAAAVTAQAMAEFDAMTRRLADHGLRVMVLEKARTALPRRMRCFPTTGLPPVPMAACTSTRCTRPTGGRRGGWKNWRGCCCNMITRSTRSAGWATRGKKN